jgi:hypothetical protein
VEGKAGGEEAEKKRTAREGEEKRPSNSLRCSF